MSGLLPYFEALPTATLQDIFEALEKEVDRQGFGIDLNGQSMAAGVGAMLMALRHGSVAGALDYGNGTPTNVADASKPHSPELWVGDDMDFEKRVRMFTKLRQALLGVQPDTLRKIHDYLLCVVGELYQETLRRYPLSLEAMAYVMVFSLDVSADLGGLLG